VVLLVTFGNCFIAYVLDSLFVNLLSFLKLENFGSVVKKFIVMFYSFCIFQFLSGKVDILELKNTYRCVNGSENAMLSPLVGALSWHSRWIEKFCMLGYQKSACVNLVESIFHVIIKKDGIVGGFAISKSSTSAVHLLATLNLIPTLIKWYISQRVALDKIAKCDVKKEGKKRFRALKEPFDQSKKELKDRLLVQAQEHTELYRRVLQSEEDNLAGREGRSSRVISEEDAEHKLSSILSRTLNGHLLNKIESAYCELHGDNPLLPPFVLDQILATYWFMAQSDNSTISSYVGSLCEGECTYELPARYCEEDFSLIYESDEESLRSLIANDPELVAVFLLKNVKRGTYPPHLFTSDCQYCGVPRIPDCTESTIRNFLNLILFNGKFYDFDLLPETVRGGVNPKLIDFYIHYPIDETVGQESAQEWFNLIASLHKDNSSITYVRTCAEDGSHYEAHSHEGNVVRIINTLLGTKAQSFSEFGTLLSLGEDRIVEIGIDEINTGSFRVVVNDKVATFAFSGIHTDSEFSPVLPPETILSIFNLVLKNPNPINLAIATMNPLPLFTENVIDNYYLQFGYSAVTDSEMLFAIFYKILESFFGESAADRNIEKYRLLLNYIWSQIPNSSRWRDSYSRAIIKFYDSIPEEIQDWIDKLGTIDETLLDFAIDENSISFLRKLLKNNPDLLKLESFFGDSPFIVAVSEGKTGVVEVLLESGVDIDIQGEDGNTGLMLASKNGHEDIVGLLLDHGAKMGMKNEAGKTALTLAIEADHEDIVEKLRKLS